MLNPNQKVADLTDLAADFPLEVTATTGPILIQSEPWEYSLCRDPELDPLRYPSVVKNDRGPDPDRKYYLYYAHHDPPSGIGCAVADAVSGPYRKLADLDPGRGDSQVLKPPRHDLCRENRALIERFRGMSQADHRLIGDHNHLSSPCVVWNPGEEIWHLYFHSYRYLWPSGGGHQQTYLARCRNLASHEWEILKNPDGTWRIVLPVTAEKWMNSQSSYHNLCVLPDGTFFAFLNGGGGEYVDGEWTQSCRGLGFATSTDGINWEYLPDNPVLQDTERGLSTGTVGYLGEGEYLVVWSERRSVRYGKTRDFRHIARDPRGPAKWKGALICPWREGDTLYLFTHRSVHTMDLRVSGR
jgi:hypothetical protein